MRLNLSFLPFVPSVYEAGLALPGLPFVPPVYEAGLILPTICALCALCAWALFVLNLVCTIQHMYSIIHTYVVYSIVHLLTKLIVNHFKCLPVKS